MESALLVLILPWMNVEEYGMSILNMGYECSTRQVCWLVIGRWGWMLRHPIWFTTSFCYQITLSSYLLFINAGLYVMILKWLVRSLFPIRTSRISLQWWRIHRSCPRTSAWSDSEELTDVPMQTRWLTKFKFFAYILLWSYSEEYIFTPCKERRRA